MGLRLNNCAFLGFFRGYLARSPKTYTLTPQTLKPKTLNPQDSKPSKLSTLNPQNPKTQGGIEGSELGLVFRV